MMCLHNCGFGGEEMEDKYRRARNWVAVGKCFAVSMRESRGACGARMKTLVHGKNS